MTEVQKFDFVEHGRNAREDFSKIRNQYEGLATAIKLIIENALEHEKLLIHSIESRAKDLDSFEKKCLKPSKTDPEKPKYDNPLEQITDLSGVRIITFFLKTVEDIQVVLEREFDIIERIDKSSILQEEEKFGYQSVHFLVKLKSNRASLPEYRLCNDLVCEIQIRTILQHSWAEIEHDIQYKSVATIPSSIKRRFMALAGMLEVADREFQAIQKEDLKLRESARKSLKKGEVKGIEITPDALKAYLDKNFGRDSRISPYGYEFTANMLKRLGFSSFEQLQECFVGYDADEINRVIYGTRQGQLTRFEMILLASMGQYYIDHHPWVSSDWHTDMCNRQIEALTKEGIDIGSYIPKQKS
ncbi:MULTISPECIES: hypothetical protein [Vibrio]|uniref:GTP pyrophosphokinase n=1 Tax=Vibrio TaxID=662 RepID=UPI0009386539|nr:MULTISPECIES: hypothetical protein [Vibrio]APP04881.1 hypothetical protein BG259_05770 [Vibrio harveyi]PQJ36841.1 hypothetical protein BTN99_23535 [Vibrio campbellii]USD53595.1 hypothetical protein J4N44_09715 [Vibrio sp. SCSIO 43155]